MNQYQQKLQEKRDYPHKTPKDKKNNTQKDPYRCHEAG
jgi:hypothetical protein